MREFKVLNKFGIHARPAAMIVKTTSGFDGEVFIEKDGNRVSGKSIMGLMTLEASVGSTIIVTVEGENGEKLMQKLGELFEKKFDEE